MQTNAFRNPGQLKIKKNAHSHLICGITLFGNFRIFHVQIIKTIR